MTELLTAEQMRSTEGSAIRTGEVSGAMLMMRAGQGVVAAVADAWPELEKGARRAVVLCGPGNNGGDGFVVARLLHARGWAVDLYLYGDADKLPPDARANHDLWAALGDVFPLTGETEPGEADLLVDALFGTGLTRPVDLPLDSYEAPRVVAVDMPSGLCSDSGRVIGDLAMAADLTVTFHSLKPGHVLAEGPAHCGTIDIVDIGLEDTEAPSDGHVTLVDLPEGALGKAGGHKYASGHALVVTGGSGRTGAARMAARAALRSGAGLVTLGVPGSAQQEVACQVTAEMLRRVEGAADLEALLEDDRLNALCIGPGLGAERAAELVPIAAKAGRALVLDADGITGFSEKPEELFKLLHDNCVLTPHDGEFARIFPDLGERLNGPLKEGPGFSRIDAARIAAARAGAVVLLKGPDTVIAAPDGRVAVHAATGERAAPWLATAGAGDVLAGLICGLMARGMEGFEAAQAAAWLHVEAALMFGPGLIATDLPEMLPEVFFELGL